MTTSSGIQLTSGQKCILDLLQRKLLNTIQVYARLSIEKQQYQVGTPEQYKLESDLFKLKEKIRRISARQKRFSLEIISGKGINTITKESFFQALGLVTKEALSKLNLKSNERRRRTTANPRFSHDAIQAKRALEKRIDSKIRGENKRESGRRNGHSNNNNNVVNSKTSAQLNSNVASTTSSASALPPSTTTSHAKIPHRDEVSIHKERRELLAKFGDLSKEINSKVIQIKNKRDMNKKLAIQNERIRKRGLDIISAMNMLDTNLTYPANNDKLDSTTTESNDKKSEDVNTKQTTEPLDLWIDMKCDESLDEVD